MSLQDLARRLTLAGDSLADAAARLALLDPGAHAFGADGPGRFGELTRGLHGRAAAALAARSRESAAHGARLVELGDTLRRAAACYADAEHASAGYADGDRMAQRHAPGGA